MTDYGQDDHILVPSRDQNVQTRCGAHPVSYSLDAGGCIPKG